MKNPAVEASEKLVGWSHRRGHFLPSVACNTGARSVVGGEEHSLTESRLSSGAQPSGR